MKNNMNLILENWRRTTLLEGVVDLIRNKTLDRESIEKIGDKLSDNKDFEMAIQLFKALDQTNPEEIEALDEGAMDWINSKIVQGMIAKDNLVGLLKSDSRFAPLLKMSSPALALAFLYYKNESGGLNPEDYQSALEMIVKKGNISLEDLANSTLAEKFKKEP